MMEIFYWFDQYVDVLQQLVTANVVLAPLLLLFIEEMGIPIFVPGDIIIAYTGYKVSTTDGPELWVAFVVAQAAVIAGSTILFFVARRYGQGLIYKLGRFVFIEEKHIQRAERLFAKYGILAIIVGRHIPGLRIPITIFAATSGVRYWVFVLSTLVSTSLWIVFYLNVGKHVGTDFHGAFQRYIGLSLLTFGGLTVAIFALHFIGWLRHRKRPDDQIVGKRKD